MDYINNFYSKYGLQGGSGLDNTGNFSVNEDTISRDQCLEEEINL